MTMRLTSPAFDHGAIIPQQFTCDGEDVSPPLQWSGAPAGTMSLALVVDDPDAPDPAAPQMVWVHWLLYNIPAATTVLAQDDAPATALDGLNDWRQAGYRGPCPPVGRHRYFFKLYALDVLLPDLREPTKALLEKTMAEHVIGEAELMGVYQRA